MPPTTRSGSARNSPSGLKSLSATPSTTPTRKPPHCRTCKRPMQGHRKSSCTPPPDSGEEDVFEIDQLPKTLKGLNITSPDFIRDCEEENKVFVRERRRKSAAPVLVPSDTVLSLSTTSNEIVARLLQPGMFDDSRVEDEGERIIRWQEAIVSESSKKIGIRQLMPCTLIAPTPEPSFLISNPASSPHKVESPDPAKEITPPLILAQQPLSRSMSADQRDVFMSKLANQSAATIHVIPKADAELIRSQAASLNFITHLVVSGHENDSQALLVLGRDESSVKDLVRKVEEENKRAAVESKKAQPKSSSNLKAVAGAAVVGAVGTWAGLAFS